MEFLILFIGHRALLSSCGDVFSLCAAPRYKQEMRGFPLSKSLSLDREDWTPSLALTPSFSHTVTSTLPLLPFIVSTLSHVSNTTLYYWTTQQPLCSHISTNCCLQIKSKQPLKELLPCCCIPVTHLINRCPRDARLSPGYFFPSVDWGCKMGASHVKGLATLQTQYH